MAVDAGEHIKLIHRVINQMGLKGDAADEAFSEGLVAITEAAQKYDPSKNVPLANWLGRNIRWSINKWWYSNHDARTWYYYEHPNAGHEIDIAAPETVDPIEVQEVLSNIDSLLEPDERRVILLIALGYQGNEIAKVLEITEVQVTRLKQRAQRKLRGAMK